MATGWEIYCYWNVEEMAAVFNGIAAIFGSADYKSLVQTMAIVMVLSLAAAGLAMLNKMGEFWVWIVALIIMNGIFLVPKTNVILVDRTGYEATKTVGNIPLGLALLSHGTTKIGDWVTEAFETVFSLPDDLTFRKHGTMFGAKLIQEKIRAKAENAVTIANFTEYYRECVVPDLQTGYYTMTNLMAADDLWGAISDTNAGRLVTLQLSSGELKTYSCPDAYTELTKQIDTDSQNTLTTIGQNVFPKLTKEEASGIIASAIGTSHQYLLGVSRDAAELIRQGVVVNAFLDAQYRVPAQIGDTAKMGQALAEVQSVRSINEGYTLLARVADELLPKVRNIIELIAYAISPIVLMLVVVGGIMGLRILKGYVQTLMWLQLWPPLYALVSFIMTLKGSHQYATICGDISTISMSCYAMLNGATLSDQALAGGLAIVIPAIAMGIVKTGTIGVEALGNAISMTDRTTASTAGAIAQGNISMGNVGIDTTAMANQTIAQNNIAPSLNTGNPTVRIITRSGAILTMAGDAYSITDSIDISNTRASVNQSKVIEGALNRAESHITNAVQTTAKNYTTATTSALEKAAAYVREHGFSSNIVSKWGQSLGVSNKEDLAKTFDDIVQDVKRKSADGGLQGSIGINLGKMGERGVNGSPFHANLNIGGKAGIGVERREGQSDSDRYQNSYASTLQAIRDTALNETETSGTSGTSSLKSAFAEQTRAEEQYQAQLTKLRNFQEQRSQIEREGVSSNFKLDFEKYLVEQVGMKNALEILRNPMESSKWQEAYTQVLAEKVLSRYNVGSSQQIEEHYKEISKGVPSPSSVNVQAQQREAMIGEAQQRSGVDPIRGINEQPLQERVMQQEHETKQRIQNGKEELEAKKPQKDLFEKAEQQTQNFITEQDNASETEYKSIWDKDVLEKGQQKIRDLFTR